MRMEFIKTGLSFKNTFGTKIRSVDHLNTNLKCHSLGCILYIYSCMLISVKLCTLTSSLPIVLCKSFGRKFRIFHLPPRGNMAVSFIRSGSRWFGVLTAWAVFELRRFGSCNKKYDRFTVSPSKFVVMLSCNLRLDRDHNVQFVRSSKRFLQGFAIHQIWNFRMAFLVNANAARYDFFHILLVQMHVRDNSSSSLTFLHIYP